jgi:hypothetical protein
MRKFETPDVIGYAVFAVLFLAVAGLRPAHAAAPRVTPPASAAVELAVSAPDFRSRD